MKQALAVLFIFAIFTSCQQSPETKFSKDGISMTCPAGWKITDEGPIEDQGYSISIEKDGLNSSGLLAVSWLNDSLDLNAYMEIYLEEMKGNAVYKTSNITFEPFSDSQYNKNNSLSVKYKLSLLSVAHTGVIHIFYGNNKTVAILRQEAVEDLGENKDGFELLERTFTVD